MWTPIDQQCEAFEQAEAACAQAKRRCAVKEAQARQTAIEFTASATGLATFAALGAARGYLKAHDDEKLSMVPALIRMAAFQLIR